MYGKRVVWYGVLLIAVEAKSTELPFVYLKGENSDCSTLMRYRTAIKWAKLAELKCLLLDEGLLLKRLEKSILNEGLLVVASGFDESVEGKYVCQFIEAGADSRVLRKEGFLHVVARSSTPYVAELVLTQGVAVDVKDVLKKTPLYEAVSQQRGAMVDYLLSQGANPNNRTFDAHTVLHKAAQIADEKIICALLAKGADKKALAPDDSWGKTPYQVAIEWKREQAILDCLKFD